MIDLNRRYTTNEVVRITGLSNNLIATWISRKLFEPVNIELAGKRKYNYKFDFINLIQIIILKARNSAGSKLKSSKIFIDKIKQDLTEDRIIIVYNDMITEIINLRMIKDFLINRIKLL